MRSTVKSISADYMIFLYDTRIDSIVTQWSSTISKDAQIASATFTVIVPFLDNSRKARKTINELKKAMPRMANVMIFSKNIITEKYDIVFNGTVSGLGIKTDTDNRRIIMSVSCAGSMAQLNLIESIIAIPFEDTIIEGTPTMFQLKAQGVSASNDLALKMDSQIKLQDMTVTDLISLIKGNISKLNMVYSSPSGVMKFNDILNRIQIWSDINKDLLKSSIADMRMDSSTLTVESVYVTVSKFVNQIMLEFFELGNGDIVIKGPFWNEPIERNHVIEDIMIINDNENVNYDNQVSRILAVGGVDRAITVKTMVDEMLYVPMVAYIEDSSGSKVATLNSGLKEGLDQGFPAWKKQYKTNETGVPFLDSAKVAPSANGARIQTTTWVLPEMDIPHLADEGVVTFAGFNKGDDAGRLQKTVRVKLSTGPYKGHEIVYGLLDYTDVIAGENVFRNTIIGGVVPNKGKPNFAIEIRTSNYESGKNNTSKDNSRQLIITKSPIIFLRDLDAKKTKETSTTHISASINSFLTPSKMELAYGMSPAAISQPIIKTRVEDLSSATAALSRYAAFEFDRRNGHTDTMSLQCISMSWLTPGVNAWIDPAGRDVVGYIRSVSHYGQPGMVNTSVDMVMIREADDFFNGPASEFGALRGSSLKTDHVFISSVNEKYSIRSKKKIVDASNYSSIRKASESFIVAPEMNNDILIGKDKHLKFLYE